MSIVVNNDKLSYVLTIHGLKLVLRAIQDKNYMIKISHAKVGDANGDYYSPNEAQEALVNPLPDGSFPILEKELLEDNKTISFLFKIPSSFSGYDIREVGLYALGDDNEEILFAVGTQQPIVKPSVDDNYIIFVDYYILLKSINFSDIYDQIEVDPYNNVVSKEDLEKLMRTLLFTQGNLSEQIRKNSYLIGMNRGTLLYNRMSQNLENYGNSILSRLYSSLTDFVPTNNFYGYWLFNYSKFLTNNYALVNLCSSNPNLYCDKAINTYLSKRVGLLPSITFGEENYFELNTEEPLNFSVLDKTTGEYKDVSFSMFFAIEPLNYETFSYETPPAYVDDYMDKWKVIRSTLKAGEDRTLLARSNYLAGVNSFEILEMASGYLQIKLFTDSENYITFTSPEGTIPNEKHSVVVSYNSNTKNFEAFVNNSPILITVNNEKSKGTYSFMSNAPSYFYGFSYDSSNVWTDSNTEPTILYDSRGVVLTNSDVWSIRDNKIYYNNNLASYNEDIDRSLPQTKIGSYIINGSGLKSSNIDSNVCLVGIVHGMALSAEQMRILSLNLTSGLGLNPCLYLG